MTNKTYHTILLLLFIAFGGIAFCIMLNILPLNGYTAISLVITGLLCGIYSLGVVLPHLYEEADKSWRTDNDR